MVAIDARPLVMDALQRSSGQLYVLGRHDVLDIEQVDERKPPGIDHEVRPAVEPKAGIEQRRVVAMADAVVTAKVLEAVGEAVFGTGRAASQRRGRVTGHGRSVRTPRASGRSGPRHGGVEPVGEGQELA